MASLFPNDYGHATSSAGEQAELATLKELHVCLPDVYTIFHGIHWTDAGPRIMVITPKMKTAMTA